MTRPDDGRPVAVVLSTADLEAIEETVAILLTPLPSKPLN